MGKHMARPVTSWFVAIVQMSRRISASIRGRPGKRLREIRVQVPSESIPIPPGNGVGVDVVGVDPTPASNENVVAAHHQPARFSHSVFVD